MTLVFRVSGIASYPDTFVRDYNFVIYCNLALTPFEIEYIVSYIVPVLTHVLGMVEFFVDAARLIAKLGTGGPRGS